MEKHVYRFDATTSLELRTCMMAIKGCSGALTVYMLPVCAVRVNELSRLLVFWKQFEKGELYSAI